MADTYVFDIEADGLLDTVTKIHCIVAVNLETREVHKFTPNNIRSGIELLCGAKHLIAHNGIGYDYPALLKLYPDLQLPGLTDTLIMSRMIYSDMRDLDFKMFESKKDYELPKNMIGRHSLASWGYRLGNYKGDFDGGDWQKYSEEMLEYCVQDCLVTLDLFNKLREQEYSKQALKLEHDFARIIQRQQQYGWAFDEQKASRLYAELCDRRLEIKTEMSEMFPGWWEEMKTPKFWKATTGSHTVKARTKGELQKNIRQQIEDPEVKADLLDSIAMGDMKQKHTPFNPGSRQHINRVFVEKYKWKPKAFTPRGDPKIDESVLNSLDYPEAKMLSEYFLLDKRIGQLAEGAQAWMKVVKNGRIHGSVNTLGAVTARCTHSHPNVAQVPAANERTPYGAECRELFKTSKGMVLVGADASGLELRCLAHYMAHWDKGQYALILLEEDIHSVNQEAAGLPTRDNAKTFIYGFLYGAGDEKIGQIVGSGRETGKFLRQKFLKTLPALGNLVNMVKMSARKGHIRGLDGRILKIRSEHAALNTLLQSAGAIVMKQALVILDDFLQSNELRPGIDYEFVGNIHDEFQLECLPEHAEFIGQSAVKAIVNAGNHFDFKCPLDGEYKIGATWKETH